jgi:hypothetical protein
MWAGGGGGRGGGGGGGAGRAAAQGARGDVATAPAGRAAGRGGAGRGGGGGGGALPAGEYTVTLRVGEQSYSHKAQLSFLPSAEQGGDGEAEHEEENEG